MNKKLLLGILISVILIVLIIMSIPLLKDNIENKPPVYSDDSSDWIEKKRDVIKIDVEEVTKARGYDAGYDYNTFINGSLVGFLYEGMYKGTYFKKDFVEDGVMRMKIGSEIKPNDGIIEGYVIERVIGDEFKVFIFLDDDWKNNIPNTNIVWGRNYEYTKIFDFNEISDGIYMDKINDDPSRFESNYLASYSGIIVGDTTKEDIQNGIVEGKTAIIFQ